MKLRANIDVNDLSRRLRGSVDPAEIRTSVKRADHLSRVGSVLALEDVSVSLDPNHPTAHVEMERRAGSFQVSITSREVEQPVTEYDRTAYDLIMQETLLVHEIGHVLYTDSASFRDLYENSVEAHERPAFKRFWNTLEDGRIEEQLRREFNVTDELAVLNANLTHRPGNNTETLTFMEAVMRAAMDLAVWPNGFTKDLRGNADLAGKGVAAGPGPRMSTPADAERFEKAVAILKDTVKGLKTEPDGSRANRLIYNTWTAIIDLMEEADAKGLQESANEESKDDKPDDADEALSGVGQGQEAPDLAEADPSEVEEDVETRAGDSDGEEGEESGESAGDARGEAGESGEGDESSEGSDGSTEADTDGEGGSGASPGSDAVEGGKNDDLETKYLSAASGERRDEADSNDAMATEMEAIVEALNAADKDGDHHLNVIVPEAKENTSKYTYVKGEYSRERYNNAKRVARRLEQTLGDRLRQERRDRPARRRSSGGLDSGRMMAWARGDHRVFERTRKGEEKDYNAMIVVDRSGSMRKPHGNPKVHMAEEAVGGLTMALEGLGVNVSVMDLGGGSVRLTKPFGVDTDSVRETMFNGYRDGGTPLTNLMKVARRRLDAEGGHRFMVVVTDGQAKNVESFKAEIDKANFPVLGVYLTAGGGGGAYDIEGQLSLYTRFREVSNSNALNTTLRELVREVMF